MRQVVQVVIRITETETSMAKVILGVRDIFVFD